MFNFNTYKSLMLRKLIFNSQNTKLCYSTSSSSSSRSTTSKTNEIPDDYIVKDPEDIEPSDNNKAMAPLFVDEVEDEESRERRIAEIRNVSRLLPQHLNLLRNRNPYEEPQSWIHLTLKYNRTMYGRYGASSGVDPRLCFYTKSEIANRNEYEMVAHPHTIQEMMGKNSNEKLAKIKAIKDREDDIDKKMQKLDQWSRELNDRIAKKEIEAKAAKERKERLVEEVRRQFGFKMDTRDERFQEMLALKEKEDRKKQKEAKRKVKEEKMLAKLIEKNEQQQKSVVNENPIKE